MAGVDTSIYGSAPQPVNPLQTYGQLVGIQNAQNQNKLFSQEFAARKAMGPIIQQATDPNTGITDYNKVNALMAGNPDTAFKAPEFAAQAQQMQQAQLGIQKSQLELALTQRGALNNVLGSLLQNPNVTTKDVISAAGDLIADGHLPTQMAAQELSSMPSDPGQLRQWLQGHLVQGLDAQGKLQAIYGQTQAINTGAQTQLVRTPQMGAPQVTGTLQNSMSPSDAATPVQVFKDGQPAIISKAQFAGQTGTGGAPGAIGAGSGTPSGGIATGPHLGEQAAADTAAQGSAGALNDLHKSVAGSGARLFALDKALTGLQNTTTGPGTETRNTVLSFLGAAPGFKHLVPDATLESVKNYDEANKYLTQYAAGTAAAMGQGTDAKLATALSGNASTHISNLAAQDVVKATIGLERMQQAQAQAFDASGKSPQDYYKWSVDWNKNIDPRAFVMDKLSPDQRGKLVSSITDPQEKARFAASLRTAIKGGFLELPNGGN